MDHPKDPLKAFEWEPRILRAGPKRLSKELWMEALMDLQKDPLKVFQKELRTLTARLTRL
jgi:hypothetical protein